MSTTPILLVKNLHTSQFAGARKARFGVQMFHGERKVDLSLAIWSAYSIQVSLVKVLADLRFMIALVWE